jgi:hypothetical protein
MEYWSHVDDQCFTFAQRNQRFNWKLLHGIDVDEVVSAVERGSLLTTAHIREPQLHHGSAGPHS